MGVGLRGARGMVGWVRCAGHATAGPARDKRIRTARATSRREESACLSARAGSVRSLALLRRVAPTRIPTLPQGFRRGDRDAANPPAHGVPTGHPIGFWFFFWGEFAERCSYYGMRAILSLYMTDAARRRTRPTPARSCPCSSPACYFLPLLGGWLGRQLLRQVLDDRRVLDPVRRRPVHRRHREQVRRGRRAGAAGDGAGSSSRTSRP